MTPKSLCVGGTSCILLCVDAARQSPYFVISVLQADASPAELYAGKYPTDMKCMSFMSDISGNGQGFPSWTEVRISP